MATRSSIIEDINATQRYATRINKYLSQPIYKDATLELYPLDIVEVDGKLALAGADCTIVKVSSQFCDDREQGVCGNDDDDPDFDKGFVFHYYQGISDWIPTKVFEGGYKNKVKVIARSSLLPHHHIWRHYFDRVEDIRNQMESACM